MPISNSKISRYNSIIDSVETWDKLREIRNAITHEYPEELQTRLENIRLALTGYLQIKSILTTIEQGMEKAQ